MLAEINNPELIEAAKGLDYDSVQAYIEDYCIQCEVTENWYTCEDDLEVVYGPDGDKHFVHEDHVGEFVEMLNEKPYGYDEGQHRWNCL